MAVLFSMDNNKNKCNSLDNIFSDAEKILLNDLYLINRGKELLNLKLQPDTIYTTSAPISFELNKTIEAEDQALDNIPNSRKLNFR
jgi:hypothetical protein